MRLSLNEIKALKNQGLTHREIAAIDGTVKRNAITMRLARERNPEAQRECQRRYRERHPEEIRRLRKRWRKNHPEQWRRERNETKRRRNEESRLTAENAYKRWSSEELKYLKENGQRLTIAEMAIDLGRTYFAIQMVAHRYGISLYSLEKCLSGTSRPRSVS